MCPIFSAFPIGQISTIGTSENKNPWSKQDEDGRTELQPSDDANILSSRMHFGMDDVTCSASLDPSPTTKYTIEKAMRIGLLPREPLGPLRFGGIEGKYIFLKSLNLRFNFRYEKPAIPVSLPPNTWRPPYLPPMKVSIMIVKQRPGDVGEKYKQAIEKYTHEGDQKLGSASATMEKDIHGPTDFLGDNLLMDPLGQPFGVGKAYWNSAVPPTANSDISVNGTRTGNMYFQCPVQRKWFSVIHSRTFILNAALQPTDPVYPPSAGWNSGKRYATSKSVSFNMPIKSRVLMKPLGIDRGHPEGVIEKNTSAVNAANPPVPVFDANGNIVAGEYKEFPGFNGSATSIYGQQTTPTGPAQPVTHPVEWMCPADVDMSDYKVVIKAVSFSETPRDNQKRLSTTTVPTAAGGVDDVIVGSNAPCPKITYSMSGRMAYNDV